MQPCLAGPLTLIRPLRPDDFDALYAVASDPKLWEQHPISNRYQRPVFAKLFDDSLASQGAVVVIDKALGAVIGSSRFRVAEPTSNRAEIGWSYLARSYWGGLWNREVKHLMLAHAFRYVDTVYFRVGQDNTRSRRAMENLGGRLMVETETIQGPEGTGITHVIFEISKARFAPLDRDPAPHGHPPNFIPNHSPKS